MKLNELEIKIHLPSQEEFQHIYTLCQSYFGPPVSHVRQLDEYFDTSDGQLKKQDLVIRIRSIGNSETVAFKSPRVCLPGGMTSRIELEFKAAADQQPREQLLRQGLAVAQASEKERWTFEQEDIEVVLDHLPFIGFFVEIEGPTQEAIHQMVAKLQLPHGAGIQQHYGELTTAKFAALGLPTTHIISTFEAERAYQRV